MKLLAILSLTLTWMLGCSKHSTSDLTCNTIHEPSSSCPTGYVKEDSPRFTEKDGSNRYACISHEKGKEKCTDVLYPGESEIAYFQLTGTDWAPIQPPQFVPDMRIDVPAIQETRKTCSFVYPEGGGPYPGQPGCGPIKTYKEWTCADKERILEHSESGKYYCRKPRL